MLQRAVQLNKLQPEEKNMLELAVRDAEKSVQEAEKEVERTSAAANATGDSDPDAMRKVAFDDASGARMTESARQKKIIDDGEFDAVRKQLRKQLATVERKDESVKSKAEKELQERLEARKWRRVQAASAAKEAHRESIPQ